MADATDEQGTGEAQERAVRAAAAEEELPHDGRWPERYTGLVVRRRGQVQHSTTDQRLLDTQASAEWVHGDPWRVMRIQSEFVEGFGTLAELGPAISVFGSSRTSADAPEYAAGVRIGRALAEAGFAPARVAADVIELRNCPFRELVDGAEHPVCAMHAGMMAGALEEWDGGIRLDALEPVAAPGPCRARLIGAGLAA